MQRQPKIAVPELMSEDVAYNERCWPEYVRAIEQSGGVVVKIPLSSTQDAVAKLVTKCDGVLLPSSGADIDPEKYAEERISATKPADAARESVDEILIQDAANLHKPLFGICYGFQAWNVWRNGSLIQDLQTAVDHHPGRDVRGAHEVALVKGSRIQSLLGKERLEVNSSHHQGLEQAGDGMKVVARSVGDDLIEAVEGTGPQFVIGVQWHPERSFDYDEASRTLFSAFIDAARNWKPRVVRESVVE